VSEASSGTGDPQAGGGGDGDADLRVDRGQVTRSAERPASLREPGTETAVVLLRHGVTAHTAAKRFSGGLGGDNPPLSEEGRDQIRTAAAWLADHGGVEHVVASPVRRTRESADLVGEVLGLSVSEEPGFAEMEFGDWDGRTFAEIAARDKAALDAWLGNRAVPPPGGESFQQVEERVLAALDRVLTAYAGGTVLVVSHVTPIKTLVAHALGAPLESCFRMELAPASVSELVFHPAPEGAARGALRRYNLQP
jgi:ribonuclease H / adenosylcobalamin/alpha-ribazole phosphatase